MPDELQLLKWTGIFVLVVLGLSIVIGSLLSIFRLPTLRRKLEAQVLRETGAHIANPDEFPEVAQHPRGPGPLGRTSRCPASP